jgi:hypothetical protein
MRSSKVFHERVRPPGAILDIVSRLGGVVSSAVTASVAVHQDCSRALDSAVMVTPGSGLLFTLVDANHSLEEKSI